jgi:hypothetical protein
MKTDMTNSMKSLQYDDLATGSKKILSFGADGIWPFDSGCNLLSAMTGQETVNGYLPAEMTLCIKLHKRTDFEELVQRPLVEDTVIYDPATEAPAIADGMKITWTVKSLVIQYESLKTDDATMASMKAKTEYYVDIPRINLDRVSSGNSASKHEISVPPGTRLVVLAWMYSDHVYSKPSFRKPLSARFHFPLNASNVTVGWEGEPGLIFGHGFNELGTADAATSHTSIAYHDQLVHRKLYGRAFNKMFPTHPARTYDGCLILDMAPHKLESNSKLLIKLRNTGAGSPRQYFLVSVLVQQYHYLYKHQMPLEYTLLA